MGVPLYIAASLCVRRELHDGKEPLTETFKRTGKEVLHYTGWTVLGITAYVGLFHVVQGVYELSPKICPREMGSL